ncbi:MAG: aspartate-semialdehyde dehydrogenase, partial [Clostridia bacterium]|nr:aspartate-semialdehyde dehydrogenase [Clostridia bacterium]
RLYDDVPLIVPEINGADAKNHKGIIANPNCSTIITLMAVAPIAKISPIETMVASTYQAVSGAGIEGLRELEGQAAAYVKGEELQVNTFAHQIAFNLIPAIGSDSGNGYTSEEMKLQNEGRKILHLPEMKVSCTCVRVPVMRSHSISATVVTKEKVSVEQARAAILSAKGVLLTDELQNNLYPMPLDTSGQDKVFVGRIREDLTNERGLNIFCCGDQVRKGAAANAVQIAQLLI